MATREQLFAIFEALAARGPVPCPNDGKEMTCNKVRKRMAPEDKVPFWHCVCGACGLELKLRRSHDPLAETFREYTPEEIAAVIAGYRATVKAGAEVRCPVDETVLRASRIKFKPGVTILSCARCGELTDVPDQEGEHAAPAEHEREISKAEARDERSAGAPAEDPPTAERVARRTLALAAVGARGLLEQEDRGDPGVEETRRRILKWVREIGIEEELEPDEIKLLQLPLGVPPKRDTINATWRLEGLGVLAWSLGRLAFPAYDELLDPGKLLPAVCILDVPRAKALLAEPMLRERGEMEALARQLFAIHWRLRNFTLSPQGMNFREFQEKSWFKHLIDTSTCRFVEDDLAIGEDPIARAPQGRISLCQSAARERHLAINWLSGGERVYSETDVST